MFQILQVKSETEPLGLEIRAGQTFRAGQLDGSPVHTSSLPKPIMLTSTVSSMVSHHGRKHISALGRVRICCRMPGSNIIIFA